MLSVKNLIKTVETPTHRVEILRDISFDVPASQVIAITGPSGSGKSTLLGLLAGLDWPTSGSILVDGTDITRLSEDELALLRGRKIGFVFQAYQLIPTLNALENVLLPAELSGNGSNRQRVARLRGTAAGKCRAARTGSIIIPPSFRVASSSALVSRARS